MPDKIIKIMCIVLLFALITICAVCAAGAKTAVISVETENALASFDDSTGGLVYSLSGGAVIEKAGRCYIYAVNKKYDVWIAAQTVRRIEIKLIKSEGGKCTFTVADDKYSDMISSSEFACTNVAMLRNNKKIKRIEKWS